MVHQLTHIDIDSIQDLRSLVDELRATNTRRILTRDNEEVAMMVPITAGRPRTSRSRRGRGVLAADDPLLSIVGLLGPDPEGITDVSANKHQYLADAYSPKPR